MLNPISRQQEAPSHGGFIPSIEGMRSLAVLVVLLFHLDVPGFAGGYLGVDLFLLFPALSSPEIFCQICIRAIFR